MKMFIENMELEISRNSKIELGKIIKYNLTYMISRWVNNAGDWMRFGLFEEINTKYLFLGVRFPDMQALFIIRNVCSIRNHNKWLTEYFYSKKFV